MATLQSLWNPEAVAARGQDGEAMLVIWLSHGHPLAMASIYPWAGDMKHEFDLLARKPGLVAKAEGQVIWSPMSAGVKFRKVPKAKAPGTTPAARLRDMKAFGRTLRGHDDRMERCGLGQ